MLLQKKEIVTVSIFTFFKKFPLGAEEEEEEDHESKSMQCTHWKFKEEQGR